MPVGKKTQLELQQYSDSLNARGANVRTWSKVREIKGVFCSVRPSERVHLSRETMFRTFSFHTNYQKGITITEKDRFKYGTRYFEIIGIKNPNEQNIMQTFYLQEIV